MTAEAAYFQEGDALDYTPDSALTGGDVIQMADGRAGVSPVDVASGAPGALQTEGVYVVAKTSAQVWLDGAPLWWDHSANAATCVPQYADRDFFLGTAVGDVATGVTTGKCNLNVKPEYAVDLNGVMGGGGGDTVVVLTAGTAYANNRGGMLECGFSATAEAQKVDWLSRRSFPVSANWICEGTFEVSTAPDDAAVDIDIGVASGTNATDFESVAEFVSIHLDGNDNNIDVQSDDGTTDVAAVDSTVDWATGTPVHFAIDGRDPSSVKVYINGARVASATTFTLAAATGPLRAIFHMEKTSNDSPGVVQLDALRVRIAQK